MNLLYLKCCLGGGGINHLGGTPNCADGRGMASPYSGSAGSPLSAAAAAMHQSVIDAMT